MNKENLRLAESVRGHLKEFVPCVQREPASRHSVRALLFYVGNELAAAGTLAALARGDGGLQALSAGGAHTASRQQHLVHKGST